MLDPGLSGLVGQRPQLDFTHRQRKVEAGLGGNADRLQRNGFPGTTNQKVAADACSDGRFGADAAIVTGQCAGAIFVGGWCQNQLRDDAMIRGADIQTELVDDAEIGLIRNIAVGGFESA